MKKSFDVLQNCPLFQNIAEDAMPAVLQSMDAHTLQRKAGDYIFHTGDATTSMGIVLSGSVLVVQEDLWGRRNIMERISAGDIFAEIFAAVPGSVLNVSVVADADCAILLLNIGRLLALSPDAAGPGNLVIRNLIPILAKKTLTFNNKITHISKRTTREKLLSFLSAEAIRQGNLSFSISFNRQQLADYLCVERSAMSAELSKLQKGGILRYNKNQFELMELSEL